MRARRVATVLIALTLASCATALPPAVRVTDLKGLAGTYSGTMKEVSKLPRPARIVAQGDGRFEITVAAPDGFRTTGLLMLEPDGTLSYEYDTIKGKAVVHEGDNRRVIILTQAGGSATTTVDRSLP
jgi:hypothetical protein